MSMEYYAALPGAAPGFAAWQQALAATGLPVSFRGEFEPAQASGFRPLTVDGRASGCEVDFSQEADPDLLGEYPALAEVCGEGTALFSFRWGSGFAEAAGAFALAAALAPFGAAFYDPQEDEVVRDPAKLVGFAREMLAAA